MLRYALVLLSLSGSGSLLCSEHDSGYGTGTDPYKNEVFIGGRAVRLRFHLPAPSERQPENSPVVKQTNSQKQAAQQAAQQAIQAHMAQVAANQSYQPGDGK